MENSKGRLLENIKGFYDGTIILTNSSKISDGTIMVAKNMEMMIMYSDDIRGVRNLQAKKTVKGIILACLLAFIIMAVTACDKSGKDSTDVGNNIEDSSGKPTDSPELDPTTAPTQEPTGEPEPTAEPTPTEEPEPTGEPEPTPTDKPKNTVTPAPTDKPKNTVTPAPTKKPDDTSGMRDFIPSDKVIHSSTAFVQGDYLFYKTGKMTKSKFAAENLKTLKVTEITAMEDAFYNSSEFYLKGKDIFYHAEGDIYRVGVDGKNKTRLYKGTSTILGFYKDDVIALERKTREIIRINQKGEKKSLTKMNSIDSLEAVMVQDGIYYISKRSNNTFDGNNPLDSLYYIDFDGKNKTKIHEALDIYDLKANEDSLFFMVFSQEPAVMEIKKIENREAVTIHSITKEEFETQGNWFDNHNFKLLAVNSSRVFYGINLEDIYSVGTDGKDYGIYLKLSEIKGIHPAAYLSKGDVDGHYLKIIFDCDEDPVETHLIDMRDKSSVKFEGGYYIADSIDVEGDNVYYLKSSKYDHYGETPETYQYYKSKLSELR